MATAGIRARKVIDQYQYDHVYVLGPTRIGTLLQDQLQEAPGVDELAITTISTAMPTGSAPTNLSRVAHREAEDASVCE